jgi:hypothetical protein
MMVMGWADHFYPALLSLFNRWLAKLTSRISILESVSFRFPRVLNREIFAVLCCGSREETFRSLVITVQSTCSYGGDFLIRGQPIRWAETRTDRTARAGDYLATLCHHGSNKSCFTPEAHRRSGHDRSPTVSRRRRARARARARQRGGRRHPKS